jgi:hypothetical protein
MKVEKSKYQLIVRFPFEAIDNIEARLLSKKILEDLGIKESENCIIKLQKIEKEGAPKGIEF